MTDHPKDDHDHHRVWQTQLGNHLGKVRHLARTLTKSAYSRSPAGFQERPELSIKVETRPRWASKFAIPWTVLAQTYAVPPPIYARIASF